MNGPVVECVPNFSEGRDARRVEAIVAAMRVEGVSLLDWSMDEDHNRSVVTIAGAPAAVVEAAVRGETRIAPGSLTDHRCCRFGRWYYDPSLGGIYQRHDAFKGIEPPHAELHAAGQRLVEHLGQNQRIEAEAELAIIRDTSNRILLGLDRLIEQTGTGIQKKLNS